MYDSPTNEENETNIVSFHTEPNLHQCYVCVMCVVH